MPGTREECDAMQARNMRIRVLEQLQTANVTMRDQNKRLNDEIARLQAIVERLPKTRDGVPVVPGSSRVWRINKHGESEESVNWIGWGATFMSDSNDSPYWPTWSPDKCYSTREAAEAAMAARE